MPKLHFCEQYSEDWDRLHLGRPTSSKFDKILTPTGKPSKQWEGYAYHLLAERLLRRPVNTFTSEWMERGLYLEHEAAEMYELMKDIQTQKIGFIETDDGLIGCSPDRLIGNDGLLEIKVPAPNTQVQYLLTGEVDRDYWPQLQGQLYVSGRKWVDIISYHPELPPSVIRVERDIEYIACLEAELNKFTAFLEGVTDKIKSLQNFTPKGEVNGQEIQY